MSDSGEFDGLVKRIQRCLDNPRLRPSQYDVRLLLTAIQTLQSERDAAVAEVGRLRGVIAEMISRREQVQHLYDRNGPQWTSQSGSEYESTSDVLASAEEDAEFLRAALERNGHAD